MLYTLDWITQNSSTRKLLQSQRLSHDLRERASGMLQAGKSVTAVERAIGCNLVASPTLSSADM